MKHNVYFAIVIRLALLFGAAIFWTFIPEYLIDFFGDKPHVCHLNPGYCHHGPMDWGIRHYWFNTFAICLFLLSLLNVIVSIVRVIRKAYPDKVN